jgi:hypothetical protein
VTRLDFIGTGNGAFNTSEALLGAGRVLIQKFLTAKLITSSGNGSTATNIGINNTVEVEFPYYLPKRFSPARTISAQDLDCNSHRVTTLDVNSPDFVPNPEQLNTAYQQHDAVGEDFSLFFFTGVPIYYKYTLTELS